MSALNCTSAASLPQYRSLTLPQRAVDAEREMAVHSGTLQPRVSFDTSPEKYRHWKLSFDGPVATLSMDVQEDAGLRPDYRLKLNSYDLGVDIELADALQRMRFEHPEVRTVVITSLKDRDLLRRRQHLHAARLEPRVQGELLQVHQRDASRHRGRQRQRGDQVPRRDQRHLRRRRLRARAGVRRDLLVDDGNSAVSLPETPLLGVLPGTGGLTRVVDKRKVRRDSRMYSARRRRRARQASGGVGPRRRRPPRASSRIGSRARDGARRDVGPAAARHGIRSAPLDSDVDRTPCDYEYVSLEIDRAAAPRHLTVAAPEGDAPRRRRLAAAGRSVWALRAFRELDDGPASPPRQ